MSPGYPLNRRCQRSWGYRGGASALQRDLRAGCNRAADRRTESDRSL